jgi:type II secretory pathway component PulK
MMHKYKRHFDYNSRQRSKGIVLLLTLMILVVLATLGYTLSSKVLDSRQSQEYIIEYSKARYACDSAIKLAIVTMNDLEYEPVIRMDSPDFSDLFALTETQYQGLLTQWAAQLSLNSSSSTETNFFDANNLDIDKLDSYADDSVTIDPNTLQVPGPYGPQWPLIVEPYEFEIGTSKVRIEIHDENAKYPLGWVLVDNEETLPQTIAGFQVFLEWMGYSIEEINNLLRQCDDLAKVKKFQMEFKPVTKLITRESNVITNSSSSGGSRVVRRPTTVRKTISVAEQQSKQDLDFIRLFHSSIINLEDFAKPAVETESRDESTLKYTAIWPTTQVNINTAPRHVLEAAFSFAGPSDAPSIARLIINQRQIEPIKEMDDLKSVLFSYPTALEKCEPYITLTSKFFTIRVTAESGPAQASAIAAVIKESGKVKILSILSDY